MYFTISVSFLPKQMPLDSKSLIYYEYYRRVCFYPEFLNAYLLKRNLSDWSGKLVAILTARKEKLHLFGYSCRGVEYNLRLGSLPSKSTFLLPILFLLLQNKDMSRRHSLGSKLLMFDRTSSTFRRCIMFPRMASESQLTTWALRRTTSFLPGHLLHLILLAALGQGVYPVSNRNEH